MSDSQNEPNHTAFFETRAEFVAALSPVSVDSLAEDEKDCPICKDPYSESEETPVVTPCNHKFGKECLQGWIEENSECPTCRREFFNRFSDDVDASDDEDASYDENAFYNEDVSEEEGPEWLELWESLREVRGHGIIEGDECGVCKNPLLYHQNIEELHGCYDKFHRLCIRTWLRTHDYCPTCRDEEPHQGRDEESDQDRGTRLFGGLEGRRAPAELMQDLREVRPQFIDENDDRECGICRNPLSRDGSFEELHGCYHTFCSRCIRIWLRTNDYCPTCRDDPDAVLEEAYHAYRNRNAPGRAHNQGNPYMHASPGVPTAYAVPGGYMYATPGFAYLPGGQMVVIPRDIYVPGPPAGAQMPYYQGNPYVHARGRRDIPPVGLPEILAARARYRANNYGPAAERMGPYPGLSARDQRPRYGANLWNAHVPAAARRTGRYPGPSGDRWREFYGINRAPRNPNPRPEGGNEGAASAAGAASAPNNETRDTVEEVADGMARFHVQVEDVDDEDSQRPAVAEIHLDD